MYTRTRTNPRRIDTAIASDHENVED